MEFNDDGVSSNVEDRRGFGPVGMGVGGIGLGGSAVAAVGGILIPRGPWRIGLSIAWRWRA